MVAANPNQGSSTFDNNDAPDKEVASSVDTFSAVNRNDNNPYQLHMYQQNNNSGQAQIIVREERNDSDDGDETSQNQK